MFDRWYQEFLRTVKINLLDPNMRGNGRDISDLFKNTPYNFDPTRPVASLAEVKARGFGACSEAAAAIGAAEMRHGRGFKLCLKVDELTSASHAVIVTDAGEVLDPYAGYYLQGQRCNIVKQLSSFQGANGVLH